jgi:hypothetical protein
MPTNMHDILVLRKDAYEPNRTFRPATWHGCQCFVDAAELRSGDSSRLFFCSPPYAAWTGHAYNGAELPELSTMPSGFADGVWALCTDNRDEHLASLSEVPKSRPGEVCPDGMLLRSSRSFGEATALIFRRRCTCTAEMQARDQTRQRQAKHVKYMTRYGNGILLRELLFLFLKTETASHRQ